MFSQLFVLTARGDTLVFRDYRGDIDQKCTEIFYNEVKEKKDGQPPCFEKQQVPQKQDVNEGCDDNVDGINYIFIYTAGLYFVAVTKKNVSSTCALEFLQRFSCICKDYCGVLNENVIQQNFVLIYEILDEVLNFGFIQETSSKALIPYIQNDPVVVEPYDKPRQFSGGAVFGLEKLSIGSDAANRPLGHSDKFSRPKKGELFSDILEQLLVLIDSEGNVLRSDVIGSIALRSFLPEGCALGMTLSDELFKLHVPNGVGTQLEDYNFHPSVNCEDFESTGKFSVMPSVGELTLMTYRMSGNVAKERLPFTLEVIVDEPHSSKVVDVSMRILCNIPSDKHADRLILQFHVPKDTERLKFLNCSVSCAGYAVEFYKPRNLVSCNLAKIRGGTVVRLTFKLNGFFGYSSSYRHELDSVSLRFEIPQFICSRAKVKSLRISGGVGKVDRTTKWTRLITYSDSYVVRF